MSLRRCRQDDVQLVEALQEELIAVQLGPVLGLVYGSHGVRALLSRDGGPGEKGG